MRDDVCVFCDIVAYHAPATIVGEWYDVMAIAPLSPVTEGHTLFLPKEHVQDFAERPALSARVFEIASRYAYEEAPAKAWNLITSKGAAATQTVLHLHVHLVPRHDGDGLALPWTG